MFFSKIYLIEVSYIVGLLVYCVDMFYEFYVFFYSLVWWKKFVDLFIDVYFKLFGFF